MLSKIIKKANESSDNLCFEIGSNSDLILENTITNNLVWTIKHFAKSEKGLLTFPTKFDMVDPILDVEGKEKVIVRMSVNPEEIINKVEFGTSRLNERIIAINKLAKANYKIGIIIAPVIMVENWKDLYKELIITLEKELSKEAKKDIFFEVIFMTYSYIHKMINHDAFPNAIELFNKDLMTVRGRGKYMYKMDLKEDGKKYIGDLLSTYFPNNKILNEIRNEEYSFLK